MKIENWPIGKLKPYASNPRKNDHAVDRMVSSIREYGFAVPILALSDGEVIDGHLRLKAARVMELAKVPVIVCDGWSEAQVKAFRLLVNRSVSWADWDMGAVAAEFEQLRAMDFDLVMTGFEPATMDTELQPEAEEPPPVLMESAYEAPEKKSVDAVAKLYLPAQSWLLSRDAIQKSIGKVCQGYGIGVEWPK